MKHDLTDYEPWTPASTCEIGSAIGAALIGGAGSIIGGAISAGAAGDAADAQVESARLAVELGREGLDFQKEMFDVSRADLDPYRATGGAALHTMSNMFIPGGQGTVQLQSRLNELRAQRAVMARTGDQSATSPVQQGGSANLAPGSQEWWRQVKTSNQWDPGGGAGGE